MSASCIQCSETNRTNKHYLKPFSLSINYGSADIMTSLELPRRYTSAYRDISVGHEYNNKILQHGDIIKRQNQIVGEWIKNNGKYEIHLNVIVSSDQNPDASTRNKTFCDKLSLTLESIAFAETALLKLHPSLASTRIYIRFHSLESKYNRTEYWHRLGYWVVDTMRDLSEVPSKHNSERQKDSENSEKNKHENDYRYDRESQHGKDCKREKNYIYNKEKQNMKQYQQKLPSSSCPMCPRYVPPSFIS